MQAAKLNRRRKRLESEQSGISLSANKKTDEKTLLSVVKQYPDAFNYEKRSAFRS